jgi:hypothetical protein
MNDASSDGGMTGSRLFLFLFVHQSGHFSRVQMTLDTPDQALLSISSDMGEI